MSPIADLVINLIAAHPVAAVLAPSSVVALVAWFGFGALLDRLDDRRDRQAEAARRQADLDTCNAIFDLPSPRKETP
ncbi:hypothetical protein ACFCYX_19255 [Streptomyces populi]|uniref:hypothetical protein n=1 Tax=Streptomyces populi TaxID=2058924 RepID=UPI0035D9EE04